MGYFDKVSQEDFDKFRSAVAAEMGQLRNEVDASRTHAQHGLQMLEQKINSVATISDEIARQAAENAVASERNIKAIEVSFNGALEEIARLKNAASSEANAVNAILNEVTQKNDNIASMLSHSTQSHSEINSKKETVDQLSISISEKVDEFNDYLEQSKDLPNSLKETSEVLAEFKKMADSIQSLLNHSLKRKSEIDELHKQIYGEDVSNSEGATEHVTGLKDELEDSYAILQKEIFSLEQTAKDAIEGANQRYGDSLNEKSTQHDALLKDAKSRFEAVDTQLTGLLPGAMAAGLSAAYEEKKNDEIASLKTFDSVFRWAIAGMVTISSIPLAIDIYLVVAKNIDLVKVLKDTPTIILSILPLYFPILWLAYSSNKKSNLSKRLIEEYTHKSVLGKTFSGLSNQIETLQHQGFVKEELRTKLLFNVLQVSAENPGKLITNYSKSDHPLMDALENSAKLADSVSALAKIPGFSAIAEKLANKADELLKENTKKVEKGLEAQESLQREDAKEKNTENESA